MAVEIKIPSVGESVTEAVIAQWYKQEGEVVRAGEPLFVIETDKVTLEVEAEVDGRLHILAAEGETVAIGAVVGRIEPDGAGRQPDAAVPREVPAPQPPAAAPPEPIPEPVPEPVPEPKPGSEPGPLSAAEEAATAPAAYGPAVRRLLRIHRLDPAAIKASGPGGRLTKSDVLLHLERGGAPPPPPAAAVAPSAAAASAETRQPMSPIRRRIAARLLEAVHNTAMLTTFNEVDMSRVMALRRRLREGFEAKHGVRLGIMSFFIKASVAALQEFPEVNARIDGDDIVYQHQHHIGVAIGSERGLVVPVIRHADRLGFAALEKAIVDFVAKVRDNRLELTDLEGGTFTITNGGVYGSLLSTPILNVPQSAILGLHKIEERPVVVDGQVVVRPMMYVALTYDHRLIDGRQAVTFLVRLKELIEDPERMMLET